METPCVIASSYGTVPDVQFQQLTYFVAVARVRQFTQAAAELGVAQPTLSKQIRVLEDELGTPLLDRSRGSIALTQAGEVLLPFAQRILADVDAARRQVHELTGLRRGRVRLGATPSLISGVLAEALGVFAAAFPDLELHVLESGSKDLIRLLRDGELDMALVIASRQHHEPSLVTIPLLREDLVVVSSVDRPSPGATLRVRDLRGRPLVMFRPGYDLRDVTVEACRAAGFEPTLALEGGEMDAVLRFTEAGLGLAVVPTMAVVSRPRLRATRLVDPRLTRTVALAHRQGVALPASVRAFRRTLMDHVESLTQEQLGHGIELLPVRRHLDLLGLPSAPRVSG